MQDYNTQTQQNLSGKAFLKAVFDTLQMNEELIAIVQKAHDIIIVSDNYRENIAYISQRYRFDQWAIKQIYSFDYQLEKTDPRFFVKLLEDIKPIPKEDLVFIDDSSRKIESAAKNGIKGILFQSNHQVEMALNQ